jgi:hypothetical protein
MYCIKTVMMCFAKVANDTYNVIPAHKAYVKVAAAPGAREMLVCDFGDSEITGIKAIDNGQWTMDNYYNLAGQRVAQPTKGLYIVNGKKVVIK